MSISSGLTALGVVLGATPVVAQQTTSPSTNQATPAPTPSPAPTPGGIGNPALENFNLNGTVTREATPTPTPTPSPSPSPAPTASAPANSTPRASTATASPTPNVNRQAPPPSAPSSQSTPTVAPAAPDAGLTAPPPVAVTTSVAPDLMPPAPAQSGGSIWPWLAALAVALGAAGAWWMRRQRTQEAALAYAGNAPEPVAEAPTPSPHVQPQPTPPPAPAPRSGPQGDTISTRVGGSPIGGDGAIVSRALQPKLAFDLQPLKFETDDKRNARLTFELVVVNVGSAPARDIQVEAKLFNAGPDQDRQIGAFFQSPGALGAKLPPIGPRDRVPLRSRIGMTAADYQALDMGGRALVVPMIAVNAVYRGSGGETQESASWLVGAVPTAGDADKLKPFPLDRPIAVTALSARMHSAGIAPKG